MERRVLLTVALSIGIILLWFQFFPPPKPAAPPPAPVPSLQASPPVAGAAVAPGVVAPPAAGGAIVRPPEQKVVVQRDGLYRAVFSSWGAAPAEFTLLDPQYKEKVWVPRPEYLATLPPGTAPVRVAETDPNWEQKLQQINFVRKGAAALPFEVSFPESGFALAPDAAWTLLRQSPGELVYGIDVGAMHVEKRWQLPPAGYALGLTVTVENRGDKPLSERLLVAVTGWQDPLVKQGGGLSFGKRVNVLEAICHVGGKMHGETLDKLLKDGAHVEAGEVSWVAIGEQFFVAAAAFGTEAANDRRCTASADPAGRMSVDALYSARTIAPGQKAEYPMGVYVGPKLLHELDAVTVAGANPKLGDAVDYGMWEVIARPMLWVLRSIQGVVVNWGLAIIIITILLKAVMWLPTQKSMKSMRQMQALKPEMDRIKLKWPEDKQRQNQETMNLYKEKGVSPLGGCLPTLLQMPIYIAFYSMLSKSVQLYRASFFGPIDDMTASFWPLAVMTGALMFVQQKLSPQSPDSQQQKMMMYTMPIMFMAFTIFLPSGLTLYILTNTLLTMAQQWWFNRQHPLPVIKAPSPRPARA